MRNLRLEGGFLISPCLSPLPRSSCLRVQRRRPPRKGHARTACFLGIGRREEQFIQTIEPEPPLPDRPRGREVTYFLGLLLLAVAFGIKRWRYLRSRRADEEYEKRRWGQARVVAAEVEYPMSGLDSKEYQLALARTRQAMHVHKAVGFMNTSNNSRALVELQRAMQENSIARCPILGAQHEGSTMDKLYRLYVSNTEMPAKYSTLLQLRELLDIQEDQAERLEEEVLGSASSFSI